MKPCKVSVLAASGVEKLADVLFWQQVCCSVSSCLPLQGKFAWVIRPLERRRLLLQVAILRGHPVYKIKRTEVIGRSHLTSKDDAQCVLHASVVPLATPVAACAMFHVGTGLSSAANATAAHLLASSARPMWSSNCQAWAGFPACGVLHLRSVWQPAPSGTLTEDQPAGHSVHSTRRAKWAVRQPLVRQPSSYITSLVPAWQSLLPVCPDTVSMGSGGLCHGRQSPDWLLLLATAGMCAFCPVPSARSRVGQGSFSHMVAT